MGIPNPRPWTPKGALQAVECTHADLIAIGAALLGVKDAHVQAYLSHKAQIMALTDPAAVAAYDATGWPA